MATKKKKKPAVKKKAVVKLGLVNVSINGIKNSSLSRIEGIS